MYDPEGNSRHRGSASWYRQGVGLPVCHFDYEEKDHGNDLNTLALPTSVTGRQQDAVWTSLTQRTCVKFVLCQVHHLMWIIFLNISHYIDCHGYGSMVSSWHQPCARGGFAGTGGEGWQLPSERQWVCARSLCIVPAVSMHTNTRTHIHMLTVYLPYHNQAIKLIA